MNKVQSFWPAEEAGLAERRGQLFIRKARHSGVNFSHSSANVKFSPPFVFEHESSICGLLEKKMKLARGHSVSNPACVHFPRVPEISVAIGVCCIAVWSPKEFYNGLC